MADVTRILSAIEEGDAQAAEQLMPLVYFGPSSTDEGRPVNIDLTGPFLIVVCIVAYRRYKKAMQLQIEELATSVAELKSVVGQSRSPETEGSA